MRQINYIIIHETDHQTPVRAPRRRHDAHLGFHYIIPPGGVVLNPIDIHQRGTVADHIRNLNTFDRRDYNAFSIGVLVQGSWTSQAAEPSAIFKVQGEEREALIELLDELRSSFPEAKILATSEIDGKYIHPSDAMNQLRRQLSDLT